MWHINQQQDDGVSRIFQLQVKCHCQLFSSRGWRRKGALVWWLHAPYGKTLAAVAVACWEAAWQRRRQGELLEQASSMKVFPSFSGSLNAAKTNVERVRKSQRKRERGGRQDRQTTKQKAARCCSCDKFVSLSLTLPTWRMRNVAAWHTNCD